MRKWKYENLWREQFGSVLHVLRIEQSKWTWWVTRHGATATHGSARTEHLAKTYAMRAAKRLLKEAK